MTNVLVVEEQMVEGTVLAEVGEFTPTGNPVEGAIRLVVWDGGELTIERLVKVTYYSEDDSYNQSWVQIGRAGRRNDYSTALRVFEICVMKYAMMEAQ